MCLFVLLFTLFFIFHVFILKQHVMCASYWFLNASGRILIPKYPSSCVWKIIKTWGSVIFLQMASIAYSGLNRMLCHLYIYLYRLTICLWLAGTIPVFRTIPAEVHNCPSSFRNIPIYLKIRYLNALLTAKKKIYITLESASLMQLSEIVILNTLWSY